MRDGQHRGGRQTVHKTSTTTVHTSLRGIIPDGLVQIRISNFRLKFPNLSSDSNQNTNIGVGGGGNFFTNERAAATSKRMNIINGGPGLISVKRKVEPNVDNCKRKRENTDLVAGYSSN